ncbi:MAG: ATP-binding protein, partial [Mogibacterium sp.]|nr:ATP-binding protein [Mogibacterium sp.]
IISSFFASNYVGVEAMSAVGLFAPFIMFISAVSNMLLGGSSVLCGRAAGMNDQKKLMNVFSVNILVSAVISIAITVILVILGATDMTGFITHDRAVRTLFNQYVIGQAIGVFPYFVGDQMPTYLIMENRNRQTTIASLSCIFFNILFNILLVNVLHMGAFGLAMAVSLSNWAFLLVEAWPFIAKKTHFRMTLGNIDWSDSLGIIKVGYPGAATYIFQTARGFIVNWLITLYVGSVGISAFTAANTFLSLFWAVPTGMFAVSRLLISVSVGAEDRQTLTDVMRVMFKRFVPLQCLISLGIILCAVPITHIYYHDPSADVFALTVSGFRILPLCMPFSVVFLHFISYGQAAGRSGFVNAASFLDGVLDVAVFSAILVPVIGLNGVYIANVINGVITTVFIIAYACIKCGTFPRTMDQLLALPDDFGTPENERMDLTVNSLEAVVGISEEIQKFCLGRGVDKRKSYLAGLSMEEMAGNVIEHGFSKDNKKHSVDIRVAHKNGDVILLIRDDCVPFDPAKRQQMAENDDPVANIGIRTVFATASDVQYQNILGMNMLTIRI